MFKEINPKECQDDHTDCKDAEEISQHNQKDDSQEFEDTHGSAYDYQRNPDHIHKVTKNMMEVDEKTKARCSE